MKQALGYTITIMVLVIAIVVDANGQLSSWQEAKTTADSSQRAWMRKELQVTDSVITSVFAARDEMYRQVEATRSNYAIAGKQQDEQALEIRKAAEKAIRAAMGPEAYGLYIEKIRQRLERSGKPGEKPLAGTGQ